MVIVMTIKKISLTGFFIILTLSIGLVSVNLPLTKAQTSALSQSGDGNNEAGQETKQSQSSTQDNQVVMGDSSILSGNNLLCQNQSNSDFSSSLCPDSERTTSPGAQRDLTIKTILRANCAPNGPICPIPDGRVILTVDGKVYDVYDPVTRTAGGTTERNYFIPQGVPYSIQAQGVNGGLFFSYELGNIQGDCSGTNRCDSIMGPNGASVTVNFHYKRVL